MSSRTCRCAIVGCWAAEKLIGRAARPRQPRGLEWPQAVPETKAWADARAGTAGRQPRAPAATKRRWRIHFVTTHFSPRVTGALACSERASTWPWSSQYSK